MISFGPNAGSCGVWQEVLAEPAKADLYFEYWQASFCCCAKEQISWFTIEKDADDVH